MDKNQDEEPVVPRELKPEERAYWKELKEWEKQHIPEKTSVLSDNGLKLNGYIYKNEKPTNKWSIVVHGYNSQGLKMLGFVHEFYARGFNVLAPDCRGHGLSEGNYIGMGWDDRKDIMVWIREIIQFENKAEIALFGISMGGAAVMMTSGENLPKNVKCIIEDCGYTTVWDQFLFQLKKMYKLPSFPFLTSTNLVAKIRAGYDMKKASAVEQVKKSKTPTLFIHGGSDEFVPTAMVYKVHGAASCQKELLVVDGAWHGGSSLMDYKGYFSAVDKFLNEYFLN